MTPRLIVPIEHRLAQRKTISLKDLHGLPLICPAAPSPMREMIVTIMNEAGFDFNVVLEANGWELLMHFCSLGIGATIVNGCCIPPKGTMAIRIPSLPRTRYYLLSHPQEFQFPELMHLRECITRHAAKIQLFDD